MIRRVYVRLGAVRIAVPAFAVSTLIACFVLACVPETWTRSLRASFTAVEADTSVAVLSLPASYERSFSHIQVLLESELGRPAGDAIIDLSVEGADTASGMVGGPTFMTAERQLLVDAWPCLSGSGCDVEIVLGVRADDPVVTNHELGVWVVGRGDSAPPGRATLRER